MNNTKPKITTPARQIGFVCASLPEHQEESLAEGNTLRRNGHGYEIWTPETVTE